MKVLKHGNYYRENKKLECVCGCEFEYEDIDIVIDYSLAYTSSPMQYEQYVLCPECKSRINLSRTYLSNSQTIKYS